jgi:LacI family transcriptional regulator
LNSAVERLAGYAAALSDHDIPLLEEIVINGSFSEQGGYTATQKLLELSNPPTAIFAGNDLSAFGAIEAIRERGLRIPEDISLAGFDDIPQASLVYPKLTTVRQPLDQMGREAANILLEQIEKPEQAKRQVTLATELVIRDSCCALSLSR